MTVQELIDELQKVEDKELTVHFDNDGFNQPIDSVLIEDCLFRKRQIVRLD